jgi:hypothetical protein
MGSRSSARAMLAVHGQRYRVCQCSPGVRTINVLVVGGGVDQLLDERRPCATDACLQDEENKCR